MNDLQTQPNTTIGFNNAASFELVQRAAKMLASSSLVPKEYQGAGGMANCAIALNMANRMGADPLMVLQNLVIVHGRPTWSSQFLIATFNSCGRYSSIKFEFFGDKNTDGYGCRAVATELATGERLEGPEITIGLAKAEGWYGRTGSKWKTIPDLMLRYRAAAWFVRTVAPELSMGLHTQEEASDVVEKVINPLPNTRKPSRSVDSLINDLSITDQTVEVDNAVVIDSEAIDTDTGEIIEDPATPDHDEYFDLRIAIRECETISDIARLLQEMPKKAKADLAGVIRQRQDEIKGLREVAA